MSEMTDGGAGEVTGGGDPQEEHLPSGQALGSVFGGDDVVGVGLELEGLAPGAQPRVDDGEETWTEHMVRCE